MSATKLNAEMTIGTLMAQALDAMRVDSLDAHGRPSRAMPHIDTSRDAIHERAIAWLLEHDPHHRAPGIAFARHDLWTMYELGRIVGRGE